MAESSSKQVKNNMGKGEIARYSRSVFKRLVLQTHKNQGLFRKGLKEFADNNFEFDENGRKFF